MGMKGRQGMGEGVNGHQGMGVGVREEGIQGGLRV
jgi:hypothetical protein